MAAEEIEYGQRPSQAFFDKGIEFARTLDDTCHHVREGHVPFVQLAQKAFNEKEFHALTPEFETARNTLGGGILERCHTMVADMGSIVTRLHCTPALPKHDATTGQVLRWEV